MRRYSRFAVGIHLGLTLPPLSPCLFAVLFCRPPVADRDPVDAMRTLVTNRKLEKKQELMSALHEVRDQSHARKCASLL